MTTGVHVSFQISGFLFFFCIYPQEQYCWIIDQPYFSFSENPPFCFPQWLHQFTFPMGMQKSSFFSTSSLPALVTCRLFDDTHSDKCEVTTHCILIQLSLISSGEHLFMCLLAICVSSLEKSLFMSSAHFSIRLFIYLFIFDVEFL